MKRSVIAIAAGFVFIMTLSILADAVFKSLRPQAFGAGGRMDDPVTLAVVMLYVGIFAVAGCYLTGRLAPQRPLKHALILGALGLVFNIAGSIAMWGSAPAWYHLLSLALVMPYAWLGGLLAERHRGMSGTTPAQPAT